MNKKTILLAMFFTYANSQTVFAATNTNFVDKTTELERVIVSATKTERDVSKTPVSTKIFTQTDIEAIGANNLKDIFYHLPGVFINPNAARLSIRGVGGKNTLLLIDGRRIGSEYSNFYDSNRISANSIERIEIVKGPVGSLYGSDALGGVINIITKKPKQGFEGSIVASSGSSSYGQGAVTQVGGDLRGRNDSTGYSAWFSVQNTESYTEKENTKLKAPIGAGQQGLTTPSQSSFMINPSNNKACGNGSNCPAVFSQPIGSLIPSMTSVNTSYQSPAKIVNVGGQLTHDMSSSLTLKLNASYMTETRKIDRIASVYTSNYVNAQSHKNLPIANVPIHQELENERTDLGVGADYTVSKNLRLNWQSSQSSYKKEDTITTQMWRELGYASQTDSAVLSGAGESTATNHQLNATWSPSELHRILIGGEYVEDKRKAAFFSSDQSIQTKTLQTSSAFAQHEWQVSKPLSLVYGIRYDERKKSDDATTFNVGGVYQLHSLINLRLSYAQGFRSPDSQELFIDRYMPNGKRLVGADVVDSSINKQAFELKPECSDNYEIGLQGRTKNWSYDVAAYQTKITDSILRDSTQSSSYFTFRNASKVDVSGVELSVSKQLFENLQIDFYANVLSSKDHATGERLEYTPNEQYNLTMGYQVTPSFNMQLITQYIGDQHYSEMAAGQVQYKTADAYTPVNLKLNYLPEVLKNTDLYAGIDNIFDTEVDKVLGSSVGTYFYGGVRVYF